MTLTSTLIPAVANLLIGVAVIPFYIRLAKAKNIVDTPNHRSSHTTVTPRGGGLFFALGSILLAGLSALWLKETNENGPFLASALCIAVLGLIDDLKPLPSILRLGIQIALAAGLFVLLSGNLQFEIFDQQLASYSYFIWLVGIGVTIWIVGCLNIYNFMDGIDGIATLQGIAASFAWGIIAYSTDNHFCLLFTLLLLGGLIAFLRYNWPPAKVFMGDCASSFLGFAFAALPLLHSKHTGTDLWQSINLSALMLFPFLFDGSFTLFRRLLRKENILEAHRTHLYQRWTHRGASHCFVSSMYGLWAILSSATALVLHFGFINLPSAYALAVLPGGIIAFRDLKGTPSRYEP